ncbi:MAG TPA: outer membrane lipoprotein carrier protein LolA [Gemmatimonadales bacterium]|nr:outer membrane lipoprotein carrier protein LolA [Gemmatimonadales bacterium]
MSQAARAGRMRLPVVPFPLALSLCITTALPVGAQALDPWPVLERASETYQTVRSLSADFVQIVTNPMLGEPDTTRGHLYQLRPSRFAMRFTAPAGDRIVADGRFLWLYTPSTTPGQVLRSRIPEYGSTGPNLIGQFVEHPRERYSAQYLRVATTASGVAPGEGGGPDTADVIALVPKRSDQPYSRAVIWISRGDGLVHRVDISEASGQERAVILTRLRVNTGVPGRELTFSPPAGVRVVDQ